MRYLRNAAIIVAALVAASACRSQFDTLLSSNDVDAKYEAAFKLFDKGKYQKAASLFESLSVLTNGTERDDTVQYYWGLSNYRFKDYYTAEANLTKFVESFPRSTFTEEARFLRIDCLYRQSLRYELDPSPTYTAENAIREFKVDYPDNKYSEALDKMMDDLSGRIDRKSYESALLYYKMDDFKAAHVALKNVLKANSDNVYREDVLYYIAKSSYNYAKLSVPEKQKERYLGFLDDYLNFVSEYPESAYSRELSVLNSKAQRKLGRNVSGDDVNENGKEIKEKKLEKESRKAKEEKE